LHTYVDGFVVFQGQPPAPVYNSFTSTMMKLLLVTVLCAAASAWVAPQSATRRPATQLRESFGIEYAEDTYSNQPDLLRGEAEYKQWVNKIDSNNMLNRKVRILFIFMQRVCIIPWKW
jgi:hypothetical protein